MNFFGNVFYLKSNTTADNFWQCIAKSILLKENLNYESLANPPEKLFMSSENWGFSWENIHDNRYVRFTFTKTIDDCKINIKIAFDKENYIDDSSKKQIHHLIYEEGIRNAPKNIGLFGFEFFNEIKNYVPKNYATPKLIKMDDMVFNKILGRNYSQKQHIAFILLFSTNEQGEVFL